MDLQEVTKMSMEIRKQYHALERQLHEQEWTTEEDALAFLTDAAWSGAKSWPRKDAGPVTMKISCRPKSETASGGWPSWQKEAASIFQKLWKTF